MMADGGLMGWYGGDLVLYSAAVLFRIRLFGV